MMDLKKYFLTTTFKDAKDRLVYYDHFTKMAYRIPKNVESMFKTFQGRGLYAVAIFLFIYADGDKSVINAIVTAGLFYAFMTGYFYYKMLPSYNNIHNFNLEKEQDAIKVRGKASRYLLVVLYAVSIGLMIYLAVKDQDKVLIILSVLYTLFALFKIIQNILLMNRD